MRRVFAYIVAKPKIKPPAAANLIAGMWTGTWPSTGIFEIPKSILDDFAVSMAPSSSANCVGLGVC